MFWAVFQTGKRGLHVWFWWQNAAAQLDVFCSKPLSRIQRISGKGSRCLEKDSYDVQCFLLSLKRWPRLCPSEGQ
jgi:hypothetical protein